METNELKQYLKDAYELESQLFSLNTVKTKLENQLEEYQYARDSELKGNEYYLGYSSSYCWPNGPTRYNRGIKSDSVKGETLKSAINSIETYKGWSITGLWPEKWEKTSEFKRIVRDGENAQKKYNSNHDDYGANGIIIVLVCAVIFAILWWNLSLLGGASIIVPAIPTVIIFVILKILSGRLNSRDFGLSKARTNFATLLDKYYKDDMKKKYTWTNERCVYISEKYKEELLPSIIETENTLKKVYSKNIIHPKYRDFVAVSQIYEYIDTGRCTELEGPNGAYNLFESELRQNLIIEKIDTIIEKLDQLNRTMSYVASSIDYSNVLLTNVCHSLNTIETNTAITASNAALTAYNTQCTAYNTELLRRYS